MKTPHSLNILPDGSRFYISGLQRDAAFFGWEMTRPWDLRFKEELPKTSMLAIKILVHKILHGEILKKLLFFGNTGDDVTQYTLTNGGYGYEYDLRYVDESTATTFSVASQDNTPTGFHFKSDGTQMWMVGDENDKIYKYTLSTAWDISTASISQTMSGTTQTSPDDIALSDDGEYVYVHGEGDYQIHQYELSTPYDLSTIGDVISESYYMPVCDCQMPTIWDLNLERMEPDFMLQVLVVMMKMVFIEFISSIFRNHGMLELLIMSIHSDYIGELHSTQPTTPKGITFKPDGKQFTVVCNTKTMLFHMTLKLHGN